MRKLDLKAVFKRLGLSKHSSKVYETVLAHGPILANDVISKAKIHRPAAYRSLFELLEAKLLVRTRKGKRWTWSAVSPQKISELFSKEAILVSSALPNVSREAEVVNESIRILRGPEGIRKAFDDAINHMDKRGTFYRYTSEQDLDAVNSYLSKDYRKRRDAKHLERKVISNPISGKRKSKRLERFIKFIPQESDIFTQNIIQLIYKDRIAFIDLNKEEVLIIENKALADFQIVIFKQLYRKLA